MHASLREQREGCDVSIKDLGWSPYFEAMWNAEERIASIPARVVAQQRGLWRIAGNFGECWAEPSGNLRFASHAGGDWPAVGDWVAAENCIGAHRAIIESVLPRRSKLSRKEAGNRIAEQVIAANVDKVVVVAGLDGDFNLRRIERYLAQGWDSTTLPVLALNKADLCENVREYEAQAQARAIGVSMFVLSAKTGEGMEAFEASLRRGETLVFLGSSGTGKSTLVNRLLRQDRQSTATVRTGDSRGRHTTTSRELFVLPSGAIVIDTPGLRELQLWEAEAGMSRAFADIAELSLSCKFRDCTHQNEPGCAVQAALQDGSLDRGRLVNLRKLEREQEFLLRKTDLEKQQQYRKRIKILFRAIRNNDQSRDKNKN